MKILNQILVGFALYFSYFVDEDSLAAGPDEVAGNNAEVTVSRTAFVTSMEKEFQKRDTNGDGILVRAEIESYERRRLLDQMVAENKAQFDRLDQNDDKYLSEEEFRQMVTPITFVNVDNIMDRFDVDENQLITLIEYRRETLKRFDYLDTDFDGFVVTKTGALHSDVVGR